MTIKNLLRKNIATLVAQKQVGQSFTPPPKIRLDSNKNPFGSPLAANYHHQNDDLLRSVSEKISRIKGIPQKNIFFENGNYESCKKLISAFCEPYHDSVLVCTPTLDIFQQSADIQGVIVKKVLLINDYQLDIEAIAEAIEEGTKIIFLCSPNDPTANTIRREDIEIILNNFDGLLILDETYINYAKQRSFWYEIKEYPNLVILQNFDVAWGLSELNLSMVFASEELIEILQKISPFHHISKASLEIIERAINNIDQINQWIKDTTLLRDFLARELQQISIVRKVYPSESNFLLVRFTADVNKIYDYLLKNDIIVKNCHTEILCENCLRISTGTLQENEKLVKILQDFSPNT
jgi:histidinol-phosphate aminotransferase